MPTSIEKLSENILLKCLNLTFLKLVIRKCLKLVRACQCAKNQFWLTDRLWFWAFTGTPRPRQKRSVSFYCSCCHGLDFCHAFPMFAREDSANFVILPTHPAQLEFGSSESNPWSVGHRVQRLSSWPNLHATTFQGVPVKAKNGLPIDNFYMYFS
jgi:hypothetical protein